MENLLIQPMLCWLRPDLGNLEDCQKREDKKPEGSRLPGPQDHAGHECSGIRLKLDSINVPACGSLLSAPPRKQRPGPQETSSRCDHPQSLELTWASRVQTSQQLGTRASGSSERGNRGAPRPESAGTEEHRGPRARGPRSTEARERGDRGAPRPESAGTEEHRGPRARGPRSTEARERGDRGAPRPESAGTEEHRGPRARGPRSTEARGSAEAEELTALAAAGGWEQERPRPGPERELAGRALPVEPSRLGWQRRGAEAVRADEAGSALGPPTRGQSGDAARGKWPGAPRGTPRLSTSSRPPRRAQ
ncbi:translation initiation factor IF-2-like [Lutra lutra]|uniref:translation initiation factor IF-2-like n=1 Tax=Lutra lutra TaxID=9657 RepID=UPI001FD1C77D|nr:translation initiation factor IF-2-like [Lutra lutra]